nr:hypothetical protein [Pirellulaceae bacterium]
MYDKRALMALVREKALEFGDFTLASGKKASYYLDCRKITLDSRGANLIAEGILELLGDDLPAAIGGMAIGADPITAAVITVAGRQGKSLRGFIVRKEAKTHGKGRDVEGPVSSGDTAVIVEDVVTTGRKGPGRRVENPRRHRNHRSFGRRRRCLCGSRIPAADAADDPRLWYRTANGIECCSRRSARSTKYRPASPMEDPQHSMEDSSLKVVPFPHPTLRHKSKPIRRVDA